MGLCHSSGVECSGCCARREQQGQRSSLYACSHGTIARLVLACHRLLPSTARNRAVATTPAADGGSSIVPGLFLLGFGRPGDAFVAGRVNLADQLVGLAPGVGSGRCHRCDGSPHGGVGSGTVARGGVAAGRGRSHDSCIGGSGR